MAKSIAQISADIQNLHSASVDAMYPTNEKHNQAIQSTEDFGALLRTTRRTKKLTQQQFADLAGVGRRFIVECEAGKPRLEFAKVLQVAAAAGIDIIAKKR